MPLSAVRPPLKLALGPARSGKTDWALGRCVEGDGETLLIVSSWTQARDRAEQIADRTGRAVKEIRAWVIPFRSLVSDVAGSAGARNVGRSVQRLILADLIPRTIDRSDYLGRMLDAPGFVGALAERIREWKLALIRPEQFEAAGVAAAERAGAATLGVKTRELARLFAAYEDFLRRNELRDEEDLLLVAAERVRDGGVGLPRQATALVIDGFYRFSPAQRDLIVAIAARGVAVRAPEFDVSVTLPYDSARPLVFASPERTLQALRAEFDTREIALRCEPTRPSSLATLEANLFQSDVAAAARPDPNEICLFDAPNPYVEVEMVAREFLRLRAAEQLNWADFGVVLRSILDYAPILSAVFERYEIPLGLSSPEPIASNPLVKTISTLFDVMLFDWRRDDVVSLLKSGYTAPGKIAADSVRRAAKSARLREGREAWLEFAKDRADVAALLERVAQWQDRLTPANLPTGFAELIGEMVDAFDLRGRIEEGDAGDRDRAFLTEALNVLRDVAAVETMAGRARGEFASFHAALAQAWRSSVCAPQARAEAVRVVEPYDSRDRPLKVAAVMGLTERVFPRRVTEDPFLRDAERAAMRAAGSLQLDEQYLRADDERLFFYLAATAPERRLILTFPRTAREADTLPSFYLDEARAVFADGIPTVSRTLADVAALPEEAATANDRLAAACAALFEPIVEPEPHRSRRFDAGKALMSGCLETRPQLTREVVGSRFRPRLPELRDENVKALFVGARTVFSVKELETYRRCPFQYLMRHTLHLHAEEDGAGPSEQGTLLHAVLRRYFRQRRTSGDVSPPGLDTMRDGLHALLREALEKVALDAHPHRLRMTERMLADSLTGFAEREARYAALFGMVPRHFELAFGMGVPNIGGARVDLADPWSDGAERYDPASRQDPLTIEATDGGGPISICGTIDRVDLDASGSKALVLDYKMSTSADYATMQRGDSLQMPLYMMAIERLFGKAAAVGCYDAMRERGRRRIFRTEHVNIRQFAPVIPIEDGSLVTPLGREKYAELIRTAEVFTVKIARAIARAEVPATPGGHCGYCRYGDICRTTPAGHDGEAPASRIDIGG